MRWLAGGAVVLACLAFDFNTAGQAKWLALCLIACVLLCRLSITLSLPRLCALALFAWCALSLLWNSDPKQGLLSLSYACAALVLFWHAGRFKEAIGWALSVSIVGAIALAAVFTDGGFANPIFLVEFLIVPLPFAMLTPVGVGVALLVAGFCLFSSADIWLVAVLAVLIVLCLQRRNGGWYVAVLLAGVAYTLYRSDALRYSLDNRIVLWIDTLRAWWDAPLFGHGLGSFDYVFPKYQEWHAPYWDAHRLILGEHAGAAHNELLQIMCELGLIGLALATVFLWACVHRVNDDGVSRASVWSLFLLGAFSLVGFPLQNPATVLVACLSLGFLASSSPALSWSRVSRLISPRTMWAGRNSGSKQSSIPPR